MTFTPQFAAEVSEALLKLDDYGCMICVALAWISIETLDQMEAL